MSVYLQLENFDELIKHCKQEPVIINDVLTHTAEQRARLEQLLVSRYGADFISNVPSCGCGCTSGKDKLGMRCPECGDVVSVPMEQPIESRVWLRAPKGAEERVEKIINPHVYTMLSQLFTVSGFNIIAWLCDTTYKPRNKVPPVIQSLIDQKLPRGYNAFVKNFDDIMTVLFNLKIITHNRQKRQKRDDMLLFFNAFRDMFFSEYLPLPNRIMIGIEEADVGGRYIDETITGAIDAIKTIQSIDTPLIAMSQRTIENKLAKTIHTLSEFFYNYYKDSFGQKSGIFRKHIFGTRSHFSFRAVISSLTGVHRYDEIHIPWAVGITTFSIHIANKLKKKYKMTPSEIINFLNAHTLNYSPVIDEIFKELIAETPGGLGIPVGVQRNPSLLRGSFQVCYITKVKTNIEDPTVSISINITRTLNADEEIK